MLGDRRRYARGCNLPHLGRVVGHVNITQAVSRDAPEGSPKGGHGISEALKGYRCARIGEAAAKMRNRTTQIEGKEDGRRFQDGS